MGLIEIVRNKDIFGSPVKFNLGGSTEFKTIGGGIASTCLRLTIFAYFCMQMVAVVNYEDPKISSYVVLEERGHMEQQINLKDYNVEFFFGFMSLS